MTPWLTILHRWYCVCVLMHTNASDFPLRWLVYSVVSIWWSTLRAASQRDNFACPNFGVVPYSKHGTGWCLVFVSLQLVSSVHAFFSSLFGLLSTYNWREIKKTIEMKTSSAASTHWIWTRAIRCIIFYLRDKLMTFILSNWIDIVNDVFIVDFNECLQIHELRRACIHSRSDHL